MPIEILGLNTLKSIIRPHKPENLPLEAIERIQKEETRDHLMRFGLFDTSAPNYYTYYPEVTENDLNPQEAEFIYPVFRLLSKIVIKPHTMAIDFTKGDVLKKAMPLLLGQSIFTDHEMILGNILGSIAEVFWQDEYVTNDGVRVPAGINGVLKIDGKANPRVARLIQMNPPALHSSSVSVQFAWEKSHGNLSDEEFYNLVGTFDKDGKLISKVVNNILAFYENSLVPHGADPFAKKISNGQIVMAKTASKLYNMSFSDSEVNRNAMATVGVQGIPQKYNYSVVNFSEIIEQGNDNTIINNLNNDDMDFKEFLVKLGLDSVQDMDEAAFIELFQAQETSITQLGDQVTALTEQVSTLTATAEAHEATVTQLNDTIAALTTERDQAITFKDAAIAADLAVRTEAKKFYNLVKGDQAEDAVLTSLDTMDMPAVLALTADYQGQYEAKVPLTCQDCKSTNVSRASSGSTTPIAKKDLMETIQDNAAKAANKSFLV